MKRRIATAARGWTGSSPRGAFHKALGTARLCASPATLDELQRVLRRAKFDRYLPIGLRKEFFDIVVRAAQTFDVSAADEAGVAPKCRDPADDKFLALAAACEADVIVSSDGDLLALHPWHGITIVTPAGYLALDGWVKPA